MSGLDPEDEGLRAAELGTPEWHTPIDVSRNRQLDRLPELSERYGVTSISCRHDWTGRVVATRYFAGHDEITDLVVAGESHGLQQD